MLENRYDAQVVKTQLPLKECRVLLEFLQVSARPQTGARAIERQLMMSLTLALRSRGLQS